MSATARKTKVERDLEARLAACAGDEERVEVLRRALSFKASWVSLGEALSVVQRVESWRDWGYDGFETYCRKELHLTRETAAKLTGSYAFLQARAPSLVTVDDAGVPRQPPSLDSVVYWKRAEEDGRAPRAELDALRDAVLEDGWEAPALRRRFHAALFPETPEEARARERAALLAAARRLTQLLEDPRVVPRALAKRVAEPLAELVARLERGAEE